MGVDYLLIKRQTKNIQSRPINCYTINRYGDLNKICKSSASPHKKTPGGKMPGFSENNIERKFENNPKLFK